jgi:hypothetical protein
MSKISLKHSGGNVVSLNSPTNAPSASDVAFKLPNADGSNGQAIVTDGSGNLSFANAGAGKARNLIINGAMLVAQRGVQSSVSDNSYATVDRFRLTHNGTDEAPQQAQVDVASGTTPYSLGFRKAFRITNGNQTSGAEASDFIRISTMLEGQDIANSGWNYLSTSSFITLSFWVKSSVAQNFYSFIRSTDGTMYQYPFETGSLTADTWTKVTKTIPGNSNLTFNSDIGGAFELWIHQFSGTAETASGVALNTWATYDGTAKMPDFPSTWYTTNDATYEITGVQLEVGGTATDFEHRSFGDELAKCQRYFYQATKIGSTNDVTNAPIAAGFYLTASDYRAVIDFPVEMRTAPTLSSNDNSASYYIHYNANADTIDRLDSFYNTKRRSIVRNTAHVSGTQGYFGMLHQETGDSNLNFSAEL